MSTTNDELRAKAEAALLWRQRATEEMGMFNPERAEAYANRVAAKESFHHAANPAAVLELLEQRDAAVSRLQSLEAEVAGLDKALRKLTGQCLAGDFNEHWDGFKEAADLIQRRDAALSHQEKG